MIIVEISKNLLALDIPDIKIRFILALRKRRSGSCDVSIRIQCEADNLPIVLFKKGL